LYDLGCLRQSLGKHEQARVLLAEALEMQSSVLGVTHTDYIYTLYRLGSSLAILGKESGDDSEGKKLMSDALRQLGTLLGRGHPDVVAWRREIEPDREDFGMHSVSDEPVL
jgi:hypothetical protein